MTRCAGREPIRAATRELELATLSWVHWFNHDRLHDHCGHVPPTAFEAEFYAAQQADPAGVGNQWPEPPPHPGRFIVGFGDDWSRRDRVSFAAWILFFAVGSFVKLPLLAAAIAGTVAWSSMAAAIGAGVGVLAFIARQREKQSTILVTACLAVAVGLVFRIASLSAT